MKSFQASLNAGNQCYTVCKVNAINRDGWFWNIHIPEQGNKSRYVLHFKMFRPRHCVATRAEVLQQLLAMRTAAKKAYNDLIQSNTRRVN